MRLSFCDYHILAFLKQLEGSSKPLDLLLSDYFKSHKSLGANDRRTIGEMIYGLIRWKSLIDHGCPSETLIDRLNYYRKLDFQAIAKDPSIPEPIRLGTTEFLYEKLTTHFGKEKGQEICKILNTEAPATIRANLLKTTREHLLSLWKDSFGPSPCLYAPEGIQFPKRAPLLSLPEFKQGLFEMQDEGSQIVANLVKAMPGDLVLDYCSGSGGKTLAFAPSMQGKGQIYLHDIRPSALAQAKKRLCRAGIQNGQFLNPGHPQLPRLKEKCNWVLADVPCTGTGALRRNPDQKWTIDAPMLERFVSTQKEIAGQALIYLKPKGHFVYVTCSLLKEENEEQIEHFLTSYPLQLVKTLSLLPKEKGMDGFFAALFVKKESMLQ